MGGLRSVMISLASMLTSECMYGSNESIILHTRQIGGLRNVMIPLASMFASECIYGSN